MNPLTNMKNVTKLSEQELKGGNKTSWHDQYKGSSWIFVGGLPYDLSEGDVITVFSQYGEIVNINLIRDKKTGKQKGFCFVCYEDQRSTVLAVDNLNGIKILGKSIRVDHVQDYKPPKDDDRYDDLTRKLHTEGCAPKVGDPQFIRPEMPVKREKSPIGRDRSPDRRDRATDRRDRSPNRGDMRNRREKSPDRRNMRDRSSPRRDIRERSPNRRIESPIRRDIKREELQVSNRDRSPRRRTKSNERRRRNSSSDRSDGKHRHYHKKSSKKKDRKKRKRRSSTSSSESN